jgi:phosphoglycolate phosphatase
MTFRSVIFDLDGTLLDTLPDIAAATNEILIDLDLPAHATGDYRTFIGSGVTALLERAIPETVRNGQLVKECTTRFLETYGRRWNQLTRPYDDIVELLNELLAADCRLAVLSNKPDSFAKKCIARYFSRYPFFPILGQREDVGCKPNPQAVWEIVEMLDGCLDETLMLGDTAVDIQTAKNAGIFAVGATWGYRPREELIAAGANVLIDSPLDLIPLLRPAQ